MTGALYRSHPDTPHDTTMLENIFRPVKIYGQPVRLSPSRAAFRLLEVQMTVELNWGTQAASIQRGSAKQAAVLLRRPIDMASLCARTH